ncbi:5'-methylthioadenosine nucleosidase [Mycoplasma sp. T363T]|uniref:5'-methylthioadenosine/S-adenosylhomocysteine nucleosidase family protein n=1 Tax=Mycoplasma bradburyae TaxID=2963128 RepID=UPI0023422307|nr:hypothetical protein [Mycoplasma bradburyae]MDC4163000.1 5'-methylthioadenosine nucleosidase [Mycoplasma bradburyae]
MFKWKTNKNNPNKKYIIIAAMFDEVDLIFKQYDYKKNSNSNFIYSSEKIGDVDIAISGIGKTNAASCTQHIIDLDCYKNIINIGISGSINHQLKPAELIEINKLVYGDVDVTYFNYEFGQIPKLPASYELKNGSYTCLTTDSFINRFNYEAIISKLNIPIDVLEMEACAIAQVCHINNFKNLKIYKVISDYVKLNELNKKLDDQLSDHVLDKVDYRFKVFDKKNNKELILNKEELINHSYQVILEWFQNEFSK